LRQPVRAFVAIELPDRAKDALARVVGELRAARVGGLRAVRPEGIHLTLKFLGDVPADRIEAIGGPIERAAGQHTPFALSLGGVGAFPSGPAPRVLWAGIAGDLDNLGALQTSVDGCLADLGFARERRPFNPHLTLARLRDSASREDRSRALCVLRAAQPLEASGFDVDAIVLFQSTLAPGGAVYRPLLRVPLAGMCPETA
jgi:2'-5' RNA ligase